MAVPPPPTFPFGVWPLEMRAETAAAFCDEPSVQAFNAKVARGIYPQPVRQKGCSPKWHFDTMSRAIGRRHGIRFETKPVRRNLEHLI